MKFGPKEIKELNEYLRTGRNRKREFLGGGITFASDLTQPEPKKEIVEIDAINAFMKRNPRADGGRIGFQEAGFVISSNKQKTKLNFTKKHDALAKEKYGMSMKELYKKRRNIFHDIRLGRVDETTQAGKGVKVKGNIQVPTKDVRQPDGTVKKIELPVRYPNKKIENKFKKPLEIFLNLHPTLFLIEH